MHPSWKTFHNLYITRSKPYADKWFREMYPIIKPKIEYYRKYYRINKVDIGKNEVQEIFDLIKKKELNRFDKAPKETFAKCRKNMIHFYKYTWYTYVINQIVRDYFENSPFVKDHVLVEADSIDSPNFMEKGNDYDIIGKKSNSSLEQQEILEEIQKYIRLFILGKKNGTEPFKRDFLAMCIIDRLKTPKALAQLSLEERHSMSRTQWDTFLGKKRNAIADKLIGEIIPLLLKERKIPLTVMSKEEILKFLGQTKFRTKKNQRFSRTPKT